MRSSRDHDSRDLTFCCVCPLPAGNPISHAPRLPKVPESFVSHMLSGSVDQAETMTDQSAVQENARSVHVEDIHMDKMANMANMDAGRESGGEVYMRSLRCDLPPPTLPHLAQAKGEALALSQDVEDLTHAVPCTEAYSQSRARSRRSTRHRRSVDTFDNLTGLSRHIAADCGYDAWCTAHPEVSRDVEDFPATHIEEELELVQSAGQENISSTSAPNLGIRERAEMAGNQQNNHFPSFESNGGRQPSPTASTMNGNGANGSINYMAPLPVGHQQDINFLYSQIQQLTSILAQNREKVSQITRTAEEVARRGNGSLNDGEGSKESDAARIRELELELAKANRTIDIYRNEQGENTALIADYENALGIATDQIRNYCCDNNDRYLAQRRHYNGLLQAEKDEHLQSRLERDEWHAKCMQVCEMIRKAYRLRCDEWNQELSVISGLQGEVRILRKCLGMEAEKRDEEIGWEYLREVPRPPPTNEVPPS